MKVSRWGNSYAIRIPRDVVEELGLKEGDDLEVAAVAGPRLLLARRLTKDEAIAALGKFRGRMPADFKFDREEANAR